LSACPTCGAAVEDDADACPRCGAAASGSDAAESRDAAGMVLVATLATIDAAALLEALEERGIAAVALHDHEARRLLASRGAAPGRSGLHIFVPPESLEGAAAIHQELIVGSLPDLPEGYDPGAHDASACPACGTSLDPAAHECAECGLEFPESDR